MPVRRLYFPVGGENRRFGYQSQPPFTTYSSLNVRPFDVDERRERGGSRPGLANTFDERIVRAAGTPAEIRQFGADHLFALDVTPRPGTAVGGWQDDFSGTSLSDAWQVRPGDDPPSVGGDLVRFDDPATLIRREFEDMDYSAPYHLRLLAYDGFWPGQSVSPLGFSGDYELFAGITSPAGFPWNGISVHVKLREEDRNVWPFAPTMTVTLYQYVGGQSARSLDSRRGSYPTSYFYMDLWIGPMATGTVWARAGNVNLGSQSAPIEAALSGLGRMSAFRVSPGHQDDWLSVSWFKQTFTKTTDPYFDKPRPVLVAVGPEGWLWSNRDHGIMRRAAFQGPNDDDQLLSADTPKSAAGHLGTLYIADPVKRPMVFNPGEHNNLIPSVDPAVPGGSWPDNPLPNNANRVFPWIVDKYPEDHPDEFRLKGEIPQGNHLLTNYLGRMVLAGEPPHTFWMSRTGEPHDWDIGRPTDEYRATWGTLPGHIIALISFSDDYLLFGLRNSIWRLVGDLLAGGRVVNVTSALGMLDRSGSCVTPESELVFMTNEGLFMLTPGGMSFPVPISREVLPDELTGIDPLQNRVVLAYDRAAVGVHIFVLSVAGGSSGHWWFDWRRKGFWRLSLSSDHVPYGAIWYDGDGVTPPGVILGCRDGWLRHFSNDAEDDSGIGFDSHIDYGPLRLAGLDSRAGVLNWVRVFNPQSSGDVNVAVRVGGFPEEAATASAVHSERSNGRAIRVKRGGSAAFVRISGVSQRRDPGDPRSGSYVPAWQMENVEADVAPVGPAKPL